MIQHPIALSFLPLILRPTLLTKNLLSLQRILSKWQTTHYWDYSCKINIMEELK